MATAKLKFIGPAVTPQNIEVGYIIDGSTDYDDARAALFAASPQMLGLLLPIDFRLEPMDNSDALWDGTMIYGPRTNNNPITGQNDPTYSFELGVERTKILTSLQTVASYGERPPNHKRSINVQDDGTVEGTEVNFPVFSWTETHYLLDSFINRAYFVTLFNLVAKMNAGAFRDFQPGEVLFLGVNGSKRASAQDWEMQFKFLASPNATNLELGPSLTITTKLGHDYLWAKYTSEEQTLGDGKKVIARVPKHAFVERVYQFGDMNQLKLINPLAL